MSFVLPDQQEWRHDFKLVKCVFITEMLQGVGNELHAFMWSEKWQG